LNMRKIPAGQAVILILAVLAGSCGPSKNYVLAVVDRHPITRHEFVLKSGLYGISVTGGPEAKDFINLLINDYLVLEQARRDNVKVSNAELKQEIENFVPGFSEREIKKALKKQGVRYSDWFGDIEEKVLRKKEINFVMKDRIKADEAALKDYFWTNILEFRKVRKIFARQIVLDSEDRAKEVVKYAREGQDFAALAKKYSVTSEAEDGGSLGYFTPGDMPAFINDAVFGLKKGDISTIVKSPYGWHIFKVEDIAEAQTPKFEEVRDEVYDLYFEQKKDEYFGGWMQELRKKADIKINQGMVDKMLKEAGL
jgi:parvulin-like peptidyl-prolyl isomerase